MGLVFGPIGLVVPIIVLTIGLLIIRNKELKFNFFSNKIKKDDLYKLGVLLVILILFVPITQGVIPLLDHETRTHELIKIYNLISILVVILIAYKPDFKLFLLGELIALIATYRSFGIIIFTAYLIREKRNRKKIIIGLLLIGTIFMARFFVMETSYGVWNLGIIESLTHRMSVTYGVFEGLYRIGMPFGNDNLLILNPDLRLYVGELFGRSVDYTFTIFGQPAHDFGIFGLLEGVLLGMSLKDAKRDKMMGTINFTFFIIIIEIGLDALSFGILMGTAFFALQKIKTKKIKQKTDRTV